MCPKYYLKIIRNSCVVVVVIFVAVVVVVCLFSVEKLQKYYIMRIIKIAAKT